MLEIDIYTIVANSNIFPLDDAGQPMFYNGLQPERLDPLYNTYGLMEIMQQEYIRDNRGITYRKNYTIQLEIFSNSATAVATISDQLEKLFQSEFGDNSLTGSRLQPIDFKGRWYSSLTLEIWRE